MSRNVYWILAVALIAIAALSRQVPAAVVAADDASDPAYSGNWFSGLNGGFGFDPWSISGIGNGGGFFSSGASLDNIGTGGSPGNAFGLYGNGGGIGQAIRPFTNSLAIGDTFSIAMDNGFIESGGTVGFGLQNSSGENLAEFYFKGGDTNYTLSASNVNLASGAAQGFTDHGLRLDFTLTGATSLSVAIDRLVNGLGIDATYTANLINQAGGEIIKQLRLFNANANGGGDHDAYFNSLVVTSVPESSAFWFGVLSTGAISIAWYYRRITATVHSRTAA